MNEIKVFPIGKIENENDETKIFLNPAYRAGLKGLGEYSHAQVLWWMDGCDNDKDRGTLVEKKCGYRQEGLIRQGKMVNTWCDYYIYGKLNSDSK